MKMEMMLVTVCVGVFVSSGRFDKDESTAGPRRWAETRWEAQIRRVGLVFVLEKVVNFLIIDYLIK